MASLFASIFPVVTKAELTSSSSAGFVPDTLTENGAPAFSTTLSANLDFFGTVCRSGKTLAANVVSRIDHLLPLMWAENPILCLKNIMAKRDTRGGAGEKAIFQHCYNWLFKFHPETARKNLIHVPEYGYWKDLLSLLSTQDSGFDRVKERNALIAQLFASQLKTDMTLLDQPVNLDDSKHEVKTSLSLAAKWAPSLKGAHDAKFHICQLIASELKLGSQWQKPYRQLLSRLRKHLCIVERDMCSKLWEQIKLDHVPSVAMNRYKKALKKHLPSEYEAWKTRIRTGKGKVNATQLSVHELITPDQLANDLTEFQWAAIRENCKKAGKLGRLLPIADVSGSMVGLPMQVSTALGILISELAPAPFTGLLITFSESPAFFQMTGQSLAEKVRSVQAAPWGGSTDFNKVFHVLLERCQLNDVTSEAMPEAVICISDMAFDICGNDYKTNYQTLKEQYAVAGYKMPNIIFWNVRGNISSVPATKDESGVCMISGFSQQLLKSVLDGDIPDPTTIMLKALNGERYERLII